MSKLQRAFLLQWVVLVLVACAGAPVAAPATLQPTLAPTAASVATPVASDFDAARALEQNRYLAVTIGSRVAGTENGIKAGDYLAAQFKGFGYAVEKQAFPFEYWTEVTTRAEAALPETRALKSMRPLQYSPSSHLTEELVAVGGVGNESDFARVNLKGKIALVPRGSITFSAKTKNAATAGALAIIVYNNTPGPFAGTLSERSAIAVLGISGEEGQTLLDSLKNGAVRIKIDSDTRLTQSTGYNIIATKRGSGDKMILLGGHYDSVEAGPGANDNGSGTAVLVELARALAAKPNRNTLVFIAFDAEEFGLLGSKYYADNLPEGERARIGGMLNFDMLAGGRGPLLAGGDGAIAQSARDNAKSIGIEARNFALGGGAGSDHQSFQRIGIDTVFFSRDYDLLHTPQDVIGEIKAEWLGEAGRVGLKTVEGLEGK